MSAGLPEEDGEWADREVDVVAVFVADVAAEALADDALPRAVEPLVKLQLQLLRRVLELVPLSAQYEVDCSHLHVYT